MKFLTLLTLPCILLAGELDLEKEKLHKIGLKVWQNECRGTLDGLICWNQNEEFPSLGIGHFIWLPQGSKIPFEETFPAFVSFLQAHEVEVPSWIRSKKGFPWKTRESFLKEKRSKKINQLRDLLSDTLDLQILFLFERFKLAEKELLPHLKETEIAFLEKLKTTPQGIYALIDYVNFKGTGLSLKERYRGEGWGLLQVLQNIPENESDKPAKAFATSAKKVLTRRVRNSPSERKEQKFLTGWVKRIESYE